MSTQPAQLQPIAATSGSTAPAPGTVGQQAAVPVPVTEMEFADLVAAAQAEYYSLPEAVKGRLHQALNDAEQHGNIALPAIHTLFRPK